MELTFSELQRVLSEEQKMELMNVWCKKQYLNLEDRSILAKRINLSEEVVKTWFRNKREIVFPQYTMFGVRNGLEKNLPSESESIWEKQKTKLMNVWSKKQYLSKAHRTLLSQKTNLSEEAIKIWFANKRHELEAKRASASLEIDDFSSEIKEEMETISEEQRMELLKEYAKKPYISEEERFQLFKKVNLSEKAVQIWFRNKRREDRTKGTARGVIMNDSSPTIRKETRVIENVLPEKACNQEIQLSEMGDSTISKMDEMIKELTEAVEEEKKAIEEAKRATKSVEETLGLEIEALKKEIEFMKNLEARTVEITEAVVAKLCEKVINPLVSQIQPQQKSNVGEEEVAQLKNRAEEAEARYLEQEAEMVRETARHKNELDELKADYNSLSENCADLWTKFAESEAKCKDLEQQNGYLTGMNENLKQINMIAMKKINEMARNVVDPNKKNEQKKLQGIIVTQTANM